MPISPFTKLKINGIIYPSYNPTREENAMQTSVELWLAIPETEKAKAIKRKLLELFASENEAKLMSFIIEKAKQIDTTFGSHTAENLLQLA